MKPIKILIVDDDLDHAEGLAEFIENHACEPTIAYSGEEAVCTFAESDFELVFMDFKLPGMNGVETIKALRRINPGVKAILMTGFREHDLDEMIEGTDLMGVLQKPLALDLLISLVEQSRSRGTVLVADDDTDFLSSMEGLLEDQGFRALPAQSGDEVMRLAAMNQVDFLLLDLRFSGEHGLRIYERLLQRGLKIPTIIVTGFSEEETESLYHFKAYSVDHLLCKPFLPEALLKAIEDLRP